MRSHLGVGVLALGLLASAAAGAQRAGGAPGCAACGAPLDMPLPVEPLEPPRACSLEPRDPIRLVRLLGLVGGDAIRVEAPFREALSRLCSG